MRDSRGRARAHAARARATCPRSRGKRNMLINGLCIEGGGEPLSIVDPATGEPLAAPAAASAADLERAVAA
ncbi:gamma-aminobutyraldehyde dehydrogenase, partial [Burkholderia pseudomallei]|nr:gamma-aminobutyraldehyde dehydrogenase [Burkholderia pseudomallei]